MGNSLSYLDNLLAYFNIKKKSPTFSVHAQAFWINCCEFVKLNSSASLKHIKKAVQIILTFKHIRAPSNLSCPYRDSQGHKHSHVQPRSQRREESQDAIKAHSYANHCGATQFSR